MFVKKFTEITSKDVEIAGGKGASLGELTNANIPVPPGFVVLSDAFTRFIEELNIKSDIDSILNSVNHKDMNSVEKASERIEAIILNEEIPEDIKIEVLTAFKELNAKFAAVRSSATAEDSSSASWAGQLNTYLNATENNLLDRVKKCWASLFTPRAIFYRFEKGLHEEFISVAVIVQKMIQSEIAGIAFSVHPVTEDENQMIIEAGLGLGEAIVSGQITPDSYVIEKNSKKIIEKNISEQTKGLFKDDNGTSWKEVNSSSQKLNDEELSKLSELIIKIEQHYGFPVDIEWCKEDNELYIVQSRPITTLTNLKVEEESKL